MASWNWLDYLRSVSASNQVEKIPAEEDLPHTHKCECDVEWVANGLNPKPCWACGELVTPRCYHM